MVKLEVPPPKPEARLKPRTDPRYPGRIAGTAKPSRRIDPVVIMMGRDFRAPRFLISQTSKKGIARIG